MLFLASLKSQLRTALMPCLVAFAATGHAQVVDLQALIFKALKDGSAQGQVSGEAADLYQRQFKSNAPVFAEISTLKQFKRTDCRRLAVKLTMPTVNIKDKQGRTHAVDTTTEINVCSDGLPPSKGDMQ